MGKFLEHYHLDDWLDSGSKLAWILWPLVICEPSVETLKILMSIFSR